MDLRLQIHREPFVVIQERDVLSSGIEGAGVSRVRRSIVTLVPKPANTRIVESGYYAYSVVSLAIINDDHLIIAKCLSEKTLYRARNQTSVIGRADDNLDFRNVSHLDVAQIVEHEAYSPISGL